MARTCMHAHMVAHVHTRVHAKEDTYTSAHTARTRNIRIRTCATPESTNTRHSTFQNRQPPPKAPGLVSIYHNLPTKTGLHRHISGCPSRHTLADRALAPHATPRGREIRESENRPRSVRRTCTCGPESDDSCAPVCIGHVDQPHHHACKSRCDRIPKISIQPASSRHRSPTRSQTVRRHGHSPTTVSRRSKIGHVDQPHLMRASLVMTGYPR